ncbi:hypothetical protein FC23_GL000171 [Lactobacillus psittaci DSM 15354]|uniref:YbbR n=1 Tax=Lactobacillus psittaci DSM 15354 TaxID=1122152 RepID=A0A0R1S8U4_9LACO|nr:hypothetical protein FC23_GL000171 [Lactobacillus psittaci DSM 15354]
MLFAILLVMYIDSTQKGYFIQGENSKTQQTAIKKVTLSVPLQVSVNTDEYYVTGYPEKVKMTISGASAVVTSTQNTQNFRVYLDLTKYKIGKHRVKVRVSGLNNQLEASFNPKSVKVNIQKRKSRSLPVQIEYNKNAVAKGYQLGTPKSNPQVVSVSGARSEVNQIDKIVAKVGLPSGITKSFNRQVMLIAEDKKGNQLNVVIDPLAVNIKIPISLPSKTVKLHFNTKNEVSGKVYSISSNISEVKLYGSESTLKKIKELDVNVDLSGVTASTTRKVKLTLPSGVVKANMEDVSVQIAVTSGSQSNI